MFHDPLSALAHTATHALLTHPPTHSQLEVLNTLERNDPDGNK